MCEQSIALGGLFNSACSSAHLDGATHLLLLRGEDQFLCDVGRAMFLRLIGRIVCSLDMPVKDIIDVVQLFNCLECMKPVPRALLELVRTGWQHYHAEGRAELDLLLLVGESCDIASSGVTGDLSNVKATYESLLDLDKSLAAWSSTSGERFTFNRLVMSGGAPLEYHDIYDCHISAVVWNRYRRIRIQTNELILRCTTAMRELRLTNDTQTELICRQASCTLSQLSEDICYSVPFLLDPGAQVTPWHGRQRGDGPIFGGTSVIVPLSLAANRERVSPAMYEWIIEQMAIISLNAGIGAAR